MECIRGRRCVVSGISPPCPCRRFGGRGWLAETLLAWVVLPVCFFFTDPVRALNGVFGPSGEHPQNWMAPGLWLMVMILVYPLGVFLPTHVVLRWVFRCHRSTRS